MLPLLKHTARQLVCFQGKVDLLGSHHGYGCQSDWLGHRGYIRTVVTLALLLLQPMLSSHSCYSGETVPLLVLTGYWVEQICMLSKAKTADQHNKES